MRQYFLLLALVCVACTQSSPDIPSVPAPPPAVAAPSAPVVPAASPAGLAQTEAQVQAIDAVYQRIQALPLTVDSVNVDSARCTEDPKLWYYLHHGQIVKIVTAGWFGDGDWKTEYYFDHGSFVYGYDEGYSGTAEEVVDLVKTRTYVAGGRVIRSIRNGKTDDQKRPVSPVTAARLYHAYTHHNYVAAFCSPESFD